MGTTLRTCAVGAIAAAALALGTPAAAHDALPQTAAAASSSLSDAAREHLAAAADALDGINATTLPADAAARIETIRRDFGQLRSSLGGAPGGTAGWQGAYDAVQADVTALIGPPPGAESGSPSTSLPSLDTVTRGSLELFRASLMQLQNALSAAPPASSGAPAAPRATPAVAPPPPAMAAPGGGTAANPTASPTPASASGQPASGVDATGAAALLDRIDAILSAALAGKPLPQAEAPVGTSGSNKQHSAGKISVDRAALDEILAEVQQLRVMLALRR
jgi:hypothetical protein